jgi:glutamate synthase (NADPH/NADH) small chain
MPELKKNPPGAVARQTMPMLPAAERIRHFSEVALGFSAEQAALEAGRCLHCPQPQCVKGCPVEVDIPEFIHQLAAGRPEEALQVIKQKNSLPAICGRVCPQENQCEKFCVLGKKFAPVAIGRLERYCADQAQAARNNGGGVPPAQKAAPSGKKVAIVGSGPAGLTAASDLALSGHAVTVFEALHTPGGVLVYGIPEFRLPKQVVEAEIQQIRELGVDIRVNAVIGRLYTVDELLEADYDAVFIGTGAGLPYFMNIPGENLNGVYSANEFLTRTNLMKAYQFPDYLTPPVREGKKVAVIGAGNVAVDAARTALRLGAEEVYIVYRRTESEMPARREEIEHAREEGVRFVFLASPVEIVGDASGRAVRLRCQQYELGEADASGRRQPLLCPGAIEDLAIDTVIIAIGQGPNPLVAQTTVGLQLNAAGNIVADEADGQTSKPGVFAGGDIVTGAATVIKAMGAGKKAARAINRYLLAGE